MTFLDLRGRKKPIRNISRYYVNWNGATKSKGQTALKKFLYPYWKNDIIFEELPLVGSRMSFDIINATKSIAIEFQGRQHQAHVPHFHGKNPASKFLSQIKRDMKKQEWCEINNYELIEIYSEKELTYDFFLGKGIEL